MIVFRLVALLFLFLLGRSFDLGTIIANLRGDDEFNTAANDPRAQFVGPNNTPFLGAQLLPEEGQELNMYEEEDFALLQEVIASDVDANSPPVFKRGAERRNIFQVVLGDSGVALQMSGRDYDNIVRMLGRNAPMQRVADAVMDFNGNLINAGTTYNEVQRWDAILDALVTRRVGEVDEPIAYPSATGQRVTIAAAWSDDTYDPFDDLFGTLDWGSDLGYESLQRVITTRKVTNILMRNDFAVKRSGNVTQIGNDVYANAPDMARLQTYLASNGIPQMETYDRMYRDQDGRYRFIPDDCMILVFDTGRDNEAAQEAAELSGRPFLPDNFRGTIGYTGIGTTSGHADRGPGRFVTVRFVDEARPRVVGEMVQKSLPVFREPNAFRVFKGIR